MHRIDGPGATVDNKFTEGNSVSALPATEVTAAWLNDLQEEMLSLLDAAAITPVKGAQDQVLAAIQGLIAESSLDLLNTARIDVASAGTVNLTVAAPATRHINITGTTTITGFTIGVGKCYFVRFDGSLTLVNSFGLSTQYGTDILTSPGDTCIIRATVADGVELIAYTRASAESGSVVPFAVSAAPAGYLKANGAAVSRSSYARLFSKIGTTFGAGDGSTTFNLPDLRGEFLRGLDDGRGVDTGRVLGTAQAGDFASHAHAGTYQTCAGGSNTYVQEIDSGAVMHALKSWGSSKNMSSKVLAEGGTETRPRNIALLFCIKY